MKEQTPQAIAALIEYANEEFEQGKKIEDGLAEQEMEKERKERNEKAAEFLNKVLPNIPDVILPFVKLEGTDVASGDYYLPWHQKGLEFQIPGLAPFLMLFNNMGDDSKPDGWKVAGVVEIEWDEDLDVLRRAGFSFREINAHKVSPDSELRVALRVAKLQEDERVHKQEELDKKYQEAIRRAEKRKQEERQREFEDLSLFEAIKNDPIAINMLKAFVLLRDERSEFEMRLAEADETMCSMEDRWSSKAAELRRAADEYQRRAEDEKHRLQSDLDDAEEKLKKAQRSW